MTLTSGFIKWLRGWMILIAIIHRKCHMLVSKSNLEQQLHTATVCSMFFISNYYWYLKINFHGI